MLLTRLRVHRARGMGHHSTKRVQLVSGRPTQGLSGGEYAASAGSPGDSSDNARGGAYYSTFKAELIRNRGSGRTSTTARSRPRSTSIGSITGGPWSDRHSPRPSSSMDVYDDGRDVRSTAGAAFANL